MSYLLLSIFFNALIFIFFKWLGKQNANVFLVVIWNYFFAGILALGIYGGVDPVILIAYPWFYYVLILGGIFVFVFWLMATTIGEAGASRAVIANKLSLIIPVFSAFYLYGDSIGYLKIAGLLFTLAGLYLMVSEKSSTATTRSGMLLILLFAISGFMDAGIKLIQHFWLAGGQNMLFTSILFLSAFVTGLLSLPFMRFRYSWQAVLHEMKLGLFLGLINVGSIFFLVSALQSPSMESSVLFPLNNIGVIVASTLTAVFLFKEGLTKKNQLGLGISLLALIFLFLSNFNK